MNNRSIEIEATLRLALEALNHYEKAGLATVKTIDAITAIKEALAQPEQEPNSATSMSPTSPKALQPKQEPVAWITQGGKGWLRWHKSYDDNKGNVPLYTTPPQRKPLTDKQLNIIGSRWHLNLLGADEKAELFAFARAIEAAHGIKE